MLTLPLNCTVRDFAYPEEHPLHHGHDLRPRGEEFPLDEDENDDEHDHPDEINRRAIALFDFEPENDNEVKLREGQVIMVLYRHGQGWLVAEDPATRDNGLVPEEYVEFLDEEEVEEEEDEPKRFLPEILGYNDVPPGSHESRQDGKEIIGDDDDEWETEEET